MTPRSSKTKLKRFEVQKKKASKSPKVLGYIKKKEDIYKQSIKKK